MTGGARLAGSAALLGDAAAALGPARILIGLWVVLSAAQWLRVGRSPAPWGAGSGMSPHLLRAVFLVQAGLAAWMMATGSVAVLIACLVLLLASQGALLFVTGVFWADGSEKMAMIAMAGTLLIALGVGVNGGDPALVLAGALLAGGQLALCYVVSGVSKLVVPGWRDGTELTSVMTSRAFGHPGLARLMARHRAIAVFGSWAVMLAEALFPFALFAPHGWLVAALAALFAFHIGTAVFMGLNKFPWAFAATYPAVLVLGHAVRAVS